MTDYAKLITELERAAAPIENGMARDLDKQLMLNAAIALRELTVPADGVGESQIPYKVIVELYNSTTNGTFLPPAKGMAAGRKRLIAQRWQENKEHRSIEFWAGFWKKVAASDFLCGRTPPSPGHENWRPNFDWFVTSRNFVKIVEGVYDNRGPRIDAGAIARFR